MASVEREVSGGVGTESQLSLGAELPVRESGGQRPPEAKSILVFERPNRTDTF